MQKPAANSPQIHMALLHYTMNVAATERQETSRRFRVGLLLLALAWLFFLSIRVAQCAQEDYTFHQIASSGEAFDPFGFEAPVLNNAGAVVFNASSPSGQSGIFRGNGGGLTAIAVEGRFSRFGSPSINASGQVGFEASLRNVSGEGIFRGDGGPIQTVAGTRDAGDFDFVNARPSIKCVAFGCVHRRADRWQRLRGRCLRG